MNGFDIALVIIACALVVLGMFKGLVRILIGAGALVAAFFLAAQFHESLALRMTWSGMGEPGRKILAYATILVLTLILGSLLAFVVRKLLQVAMLGWVDRLAGAALGLGAAMLVAALILLPLAAYSDPGSNLLKDSKLAPYVTVVADVASWITPHKLSEAYRDGVARLRAFWREQWDAAPRAGQRKG